LLFVQSVAEIAAEIAELQELHGGPPASGQSALDVAKRTSARDPEGILADIADEGLSAVVITSGALLTATRVKRLPRDIGLEVTLFGADAELHDRIVGCRGTLGRVIEGVARAREHGCRLFVSVVVSALNAHEVNRPGI
jgi:MoaA/NifB/PqqE/SkfB family radical SAM enzyme